MQCPDCGAHIGEEDRFCGECGRPVESTAVATAPQELATGTLPERTPETARRDAAATYGLPAIDTATAAAPPRRRRGLFLGLLGVWAAVVALCMGGAVIFVALRSEDAPTPAPTPEVMPTKQPQGTLAYAEEFEGNDDGWDVYDGEDTWAGYIDGGYRLGVRIADYVTWANPTWDESFANFEIEVDVRQVEGPIDDTAGVLVRYQADDENYYWFQISNDGFYSAIMLRDGEWEILQEWESSDAIRTGLDVVNRIKVVCYEDEFEFYVNDTYLTTIADDTFATGNIGLAAGTFDEPDIVIEFDNLTVRVLEE